MKSSRGHAGSLHVSFPVPLKMHMSRWKYSTGLIQGSSKNLAVFYRCGKKAEVECSIRNLGKKLIRITHDIWHCVCELNNYNMDL